MTMTAVAEPGTIEITELEEMLKESVPCESPVCASGYKEPAAWILTHKGAPASCSIMHCQPCHDQLLRYIAWVVAKPTFSFTCSRCKAHPLKEPDIIHRTI